MTVFGHEGVRPWFMSLFLYIVIPNPFPKKPAGEWNAEVNHYICHFSQISNSYISCAWNKKRKLQSELKRNEYSWLAKYLISTAGKEMRRNILVKETVKYLLQDFCQPLKKTQQVIWSLVLCENRTDLHTLNPLQQCPIAHIIMIGKYKA